MNTKRSIATEDWARFGDGFPPLLVRMGLHNGEATERAGDYFGQPVNRVARIEAGGHGGQELLSHVAVGSVREYLSGKRSGGPWRWSCGEGPASEDGG